MDGDGQDVLGHVRGGGECGVCHIVGTHGYSHQPGHGSFMFVSGVWLGPVDISSARLCVSHNVI